jgi:hypothetical protein
VHLAYIARNVATVDPEKERRRLRQLYAGMVDGELEEIAQDAVSLSDVARKALQAELARRRPEIALPDPIASSPPVPEQPPRPVMLRRYRDLPDALLAKSILDSASIECYLIDENTIRMDWMWSTLLGGVKLWVREEDADAGDLLDLDYLESFDVEGVGKYRQPRCPKINEAPAVRDALAPFSLSSYARRLGLLFLRPCLGSHERRSAVISLG